MLSCVLITVAQPPLSSSSSPALDPFQPLCTGIEIRSRRFLLRHCSSASSRVIRPGHTHILLRLGRVHKLFACCAVSPEQPCCRAKQPQLSPERAGSYLFESRRVQSSQSVSRQEPSRTPCCFVAKHDRCDAKVTRHRPQNQDESKV